MTTNVYFDNNATTPLDPRVREAMVRWLEHHGNPSSAHRAGREARRAVEEARGQVASLLGGRPDEVTFTSSGTEANNTVIFALARRAGSVRHLVTTALEHPSIRAAAAAAGEMGIEVTEVAPKADGRVAPASIAEALRDDTGLVCLMLANNELGTIQPVAEVAALCRHRGVPVLCDAVQAVGKIPVRVDELGVDYLVLGGHKFHGPLGGAALWVRDGATLGSLIVGAPQEHGRRASTENVPAIVGLGCAAELAATELEERHRHLDGLRRRFEDGLVGIPDAVVHCAGSPRLPQTTHAAFGGLSGHALLLRLDEAGYAVSTGAACHAGMPQPSRVLLAMGVSEEESLASLRVSFGMTNSASAVDAFLGALEAEVRRLRS